MTNIIYLFRVDALNAAALATDGSIVRSWHGEGIYAMQYLSNRASFQAYIDHFNGEDYAVCNYLEEIPSDPEFYAALARNQQEDSMDSTTTD